MKIDCCNDGLFVSVLTADGKLQQAISTAKPTQLVCKSSQGIDSTSAIDR